MHFKSVHIGRKHSPIFDDHVDVIVLKRKVDLSNSLAFPATMARISVDSISLNFQNFDYEWSAFPDGSESGFSSEEWANWMNEASGKQIKC